ncbi:MAG: M1 family peptidase, partial [Rhodothermaceae bacterium]|nr:M1 family peptidase [Rhodothermaceae bacterium]
MDVQAYDVRLRLDPLSLHLSGRAVLTVQHPDTLAALPLLLDWAMNTSQVRVNDTDVVIKRHLDHLLIPLAGGDSSVVEIIYQGTAEDGLYRAEVDGQVVAFTDGWPARVAGWMPAVVTPSDPARLTLQVVVPEEYDVVLGGEPVIEGTPTMTGNWRRYRYTLADDAPVYTFAFAIAESFTVVTDTSAGGIPLRHALLEPAKASLLDRTGAVLDTLVALLGPYPYFSYTTVQVPLEYAGMENAAAPFLRADLYEEASGRNPVEEVNVHEAVHQWFGNDVVPNDWSGLWLAEGFATYLTTVVYERLDGAEAAREHRVLMAQLPAREARRALVPEVYDAPEDLLSATVYQKGGAVLHLLRLMLGDEVFFRSLRRVLADYADRPLSTVALQTLLEDESGRDLDGVFDFWVYGTRIPTLRTQWDAAAQRLTWEVEGDEQTLFGVPYELLVRQGARNVYVPATEGAITLAGSE